MAQLINEETSNYLKERFEKDLVNEVELIVYSSDKENEYSQFAKGFTEELVQLNGKLKLINKKVNTLSSEEGITTDPTIRIGQSQGYDLVFNGVPAGHEAGTFVEAIIMVSCGKTDLSDKLKSSLHKLTKKTSLQVFVTPTCPHCPHMAQLAFKLAVEFPDKISAEVVEASENPELSQKYEVSSVPQQLINWEKESSTLGVQTEQQYIQQILDT